MCSRIDGLIDSYEHAVKIAKEIGYPVTIKATAGGGGKGMRAVWKEEDLKDRWDSAIQEAVAAFGNGGMYMEKLIEEPAILKFRLREIKMEEHVTFLKETVLSREEIRN